MSFVNEIKREISGKTAFLLKKKDPVRKSILKTIIKL